MRRGSTNSEGEEIVRVNAPLLRDEHAKLSWLAASRGVDRSALAAEFIRGCLECVSCSENHLEPAPIAETNPSDPSPARSLRSSWSRSSTRWAPPARQRRRDRCGG